MRKIASESARDRRISIANARSVESIKVRLKLLEEKNATMREKCRELFGEKENLKSRLDGEKSKNKELEHKLASLQVELTKTKREITEKSNKRMEDEILNKMENSSSTTDVIATVERAVQNWSLCQGCQNKLENFTNGVTTVTITRSELDIMEKDMQVLRDAVIAREEAWDKAMEREQTYRQQILRLTCETITMRHIQESREEELRVIRNILKEREGDLRSLQKRESSLRKIVTKLNRYQRDPEVNLGNFPTLELTEKEQRIIEECSRQVLSSLKGKQRTKSKGNVVSESQQQCYYMSIYEKYLHIILVSQVYSKCIHNAILKARILQAVERMN
ncbi:unconventional myosin-XVIIIa-like [Vespa crabro]|uniref:unconventional myosin-XVIIIa-like n=1 Tax=Vespa crabro TaxID=7445 RepID=UPI001F0089B1|nr:unconventional myosin-XVIIIa-like [Vespa crabro]